jgi:2-oxoglutarate dehydrogenase E1 component
MRKVSEMMQESRANSYLFGGNAPYVEELYEAYLDNPGSVPDKWRAYFDALQNVPATDGSTSRDMAHARSSSRSRAQATTPSATALQRDWRSRASRSTSSR